MRGPARTYHSSAWATVALGVAACSQPVEGLAPGPESQGPTPIAEPFFAHIIGETEDGGRVQWLVDLSISPAAVRRLLTQTEGRFSESGGGVVGPAGRWFVYRDASLADRPWVAAPISRAGDLGPAVRLSIPDTVRLVSWSPTGDAAAFAGPDVSSPTGRWTGVVRLEAEGPTANLLTTESGFEPAGWSASGRYLLVRQRLDRVRYRWSVFDAVTGVERERLGTEPPTWVGDDLFYESGRRLFRLPAEGGPPKDVLLDRPQYTFNAFVAPPHQGPVYVEVVATDRTELRLLTFTAEVSSIVLPFPIPVRTILRWDAQARFMISTDGQPFSGAIYLTRFADAEAPTVSEVFERADPNSDELIGFVTSTAGYFLHRGELHRFDIGKDAVEVTNLRVRPIQFLETDPARRRLFITEAGEAYAFDPNGRFKTIELGPNERADLLGRGVSPNGWTVLVNVQTEASSLEVRAVDLRPDRPTAVGAPVLNDLSIRSAWVHPQVVP